MTKGIIVEAARVFFKQKIDMKCIALQDVEESPYTSWRIVVLGPCDDVVDAAAESIKSDISSKSVETPASVSVPSSSSTSAPPTGCPFHK